MARINPSFYSVYIVTNIHKQVLYTGVTNSLEERIIEHYIDSTEKKHFAGKYNCYYLLYFEDFEYINDAIAREKEIKGWVRRKKNQLISQSNPQWNFLNEEILGEWPPTNIYPRRDL